MWPWSQSWRNLWRTWPCVSEPIVTSPGPRASSPTTSTARIMSYSFLKTELESTVYTLEKPKLLLELPRSSPAQCTSVPAGSLPQASLNSGSTGSHWWKGAWNKVILWELTPRLSWGKSRIPMEEGLIRASPLWERLGIYTCGTLSWAGRNPTCVPGFLTHQSHHPGLAGFEIWNQRLCYCQAHGVGLRPGINKSTWKCNNRYPRVLLKATGHSIVDL